MTPTRPRLPCNHPGCRELVEAGERRCPAHRREAYRVYDRDRPPRSKRGYDRAHYRLRKLVMAEQPLCVACEKAGRIEPGIEMDHIDGDVMNKDRDNLQMLCKRCHSRKTAREQGGLGR